MEKVTPFSIENSPHRDSMLAIQQAALDAVDPYAAVCRHVQRQGNELLIAGQSYDLAKARRIWVVGGGKAAVPMTAALHTILGEQVSGGLVVTKYGHTDLGWDAGAGDCGPVEVVEAAHPVPDEAGVDGARRMAALLAESTARDLVLAVISGGGSALLTLPAAGLTLSDLQETTNILLRSGADIVELNTIRKHLSEIKGGGMARVAGQARVAGLVLSDVVGDPLDAIASGPLSPDHSTFADAWAVLKRYDLVEKVPPPVRQRIEAGCEGLVPETLKPDAALFRRVQTAIIGSNRLAAEAAIDAASARGLNALLLSTFVEGEARHVARVAVGLAKELVAHDRPVARPACLVWGSETTVTVQGAGLGGRNQEQALAAALAMEGLPGVVLVALATDGTDGPTAAAGAVATGQTMPRARSLGLEAEAYLENNDAYHFFDALGDLIWTGPTGTNVNDLLFIFAFP
jgi:hydroxypyruvate reductase